MSAHDVGPVLLRRVVDPLTGEVTLYPIEDARTVELHAGDEFVTAMFAVSPFS